MHVVPQFYVCLQFQHCQDYLKETKLKLIKNLNFKCNKIEKKLKFNQLTNHQISSQILLTFNSLKILLTTCTTCKLLLMTFEQ
jgi:hypothetical protein